LLHQWTADFFEQRVEHQFLQLCLEQQYIEQPLQQFSQQRVEYQFNLLVQQPDEPAKQSGEQFFGQQPDEPAKQSGEQFFGQQPDEPWLSWQHVQLQLETAPALVLHESSNG
jgi:hypothetical protein